MSSRGRVKLCQSQDVFGGPPPPHLAGYLAPEYRAHKKYTDTEVEKMWIFALGETLKRATLTSHAATTLLSKELCEVLSRTTRLQATSRASLMYLLDVISEYCKKRQQNRPFSHIVMDLHQEAMAALEVAMDTPWGPPAMPELRPLTRNRSECAIDGYGDTIPRRWMGFTSRNDHELKTFPKLTREASTSMDRLGCPLGIENTPGTVVRPNSICVHDTWYVSNENFDDFHKIDSEKQGNWPNATSATHLGSKEAPNEMPPPTNNSVPSSKRVKVRRNPVQRAASRLYRARNVEGSGKGNGESTEEKNGRDCIGPEFVVRAGLVNKRLKMTESNKSGSKKTVTIIMLNGQKLNLSCNLNTTTAGQIFELIIHKEHIEENFMLGLSALIAGDFVFLPSDTRIIKAFHPENTQGVSLTLFVRVRFFLPSLRGIRGAQARHLLYLQIRRSILEHQLPCSFSQIIELDGLALQAEFGDYNEKEHGTRDYFLLEHYVPETMSCMIEDSKKLREELISAHISKKGLEIEKAEKDFITLAQSLPHFGGHFYTATLILKDNHLKDVWLYVSAQGINLYERGQLASHFGPQLYEMFEWRSIQTLCYSKHYLCILPHSNMHHSSKLRKYKLKMDHKKSYFTFRLASLHHQFFLRLRTEYASLQSLSQQFGIPLKDIKNETNSLFKLEILTNPSYVENAETEFKIEFRMSSRSSGKTEDFLETKRSKSMDDFNALEDKVNEECQNKANENPQHFSSGLVLDSSYLSGLCSGNALEKRRGVKMGTRAYGNGNRVSRSMEAVNATAGNDYLEEMSLQSVSLHCSSTSISKTSTVECSNNEVYIMDSTLKVNSQQILPDFQETLSQSLQEKLNCMSFAEERILCTVLIERDIKGSLGMQIMEGSDGNVYIQSVIPNGSAQKSGNILRGDQIVAVDGHSLLGTKYEEALNLLKNTGRKVEFIFSRLFGKEKNSLPRGNFAESFSTENSNLKESLLRRSPVEKHLIESCLDISNLRKCQNKQTEVPYHKHIRYEIEQEKSNSVSKKPLGLKKVFIGSFKKSMSKSCSNLYNSNKAVVVEVIPKPNVNLTNFYLLDRQYLKNFKTPEKSDVNPIVPVPRSLGLSRKWRGPVRYPVTPVKNASSLKEDTTDDEQVFI